MKHFYRFWAFLLALCMIFPLSACLGEEAEVTTEPPLTSAEETTAEETLPPEEETTTLYDKLAAMDPLALLRQGAKNTRSYRRFIKTTQLALDVPEVGKESREIVYVRNHDDFSEKYSVDGEITSFVMYAGGEFSIYNSMLGKMGYSTKVESEEEYKKLEGNGPVVANPLLFDFSGNENFEEGIISAGDEGFIISIALSKKGKEVLVGNNYGDLNWDYTVNKAEIIAWLDREGNIISVSFEAELNLEKLGRKEPVYLTAYSTLEEVGGEVTVTAPSELEFFAFEKFDSFYNFYAKASYNHSRIVGSGISFSYAHSTRIEQSENNYRKTVYDCMLRGRYKKDESVSIAREFMDRGNVTAREDYEYSFAGGKVIYTSQSGEQTERSDIQGEAIYNYVMNGCFANLDLDYMQGIYSASKDTSYFKLTNEQALELMKQYLALCEIDAEKCEISLIQAQVEMSGKSEYSEYIHFDIYVSADVKYEGRELNFIVRDTLTQKLG